MWRYKRVLRIYREEHKTSEEVLQAEDVTERLLSQLIKRKLRYAGHVIRGSSGYLFNSTWRAELRAGKLKSTLKGAVLMTSSNGPTIVHMEKSNGKQSREERRVIVANLLTEENT
ncbi:hypothetical protein ElyMa_001579800 [Elysia marginata]|uniref:Uncharacterized protein n=1 Tax=Elysia marginata TaxID=1093978 RepID=A0AAV4JDD3_9GAST|nr:hypothetical protein ElyMa_001579800 [Elysia marginata]